LQSLYDGAQAPRLRLPGLGNVPHSVARHGSLMVLDPSKLSNDRKPAMKEKTASVHWEGKGKDGQRKISTETGALKNYPYGFGSRFEDDRRGTNAEEIRKHAESQVAIANPGPQRRSSR